MFFPRSLIRCGVAVLVVAAGGSALCAACGTVLEIADNPVERDGGATDGTSTTDSSAGRDGSLEADADAGVDASPLSPCNDLADFDDVTELQDLGSVTSVRLSTNEKTAFVSFLAAPGNDDIDEGDFPKGSLLYAHVVDTANADTHPSPVTDPNRLIFESGATGARAIVQATRAQLGQAFGTPTPLFPADGGGAQTREPYVLGNGSVVYFTMEPGDVGGRDVYRASLDGGTWTRQIVAGVSQSLQDGHPVVTNDELAIFFSRGDLPTKPTAIWMATRADKNAAFVDAVPIAKLAGQDAGMPTDDRPTWVSADRCTLFFVSNRSGAYRAYRATRR